MLKITEAQAIVEQRMPVSITISSIVEHPYKACGLSARIRHYVSYRHLLFPKSTAVTEIILRRNNARASFENSEWNHFTTIELPPSTILVVDQSSYVSYSIRLGNWTTTTRCVYIDELISDPRTVAYQEYIVYTAAGRRQ